MMRKQSLLKKMITVLIAVSMMVMVLLPTQPAKAQDIPNGMEEVTATGTVTATTTGDVQYTAAAYEVLKLVIPKGSAQPEAMGDTGVYCVTDDFDDFFATAKAAYKDDVKAASALYLTYDAANHCLNISTSANGTENEDYIVISNTAKLDETYFGADVISHIASSPGNADAATASAARLFSDWLTKYAQDKHLSGTAGVRSSMKDDDGNVTDTKYTFSGLPYGYYLIVASGEDGKKVINQSILDVPSTSEITLKASDITLDKSVQNKTNERASAVDEDGANGADKTTAAVGDTLEYAVHTSIPSLTSYSFEDYSSPLEGDFSSKEKIDAYAASNYIYCFYDVMKNQKLDGAGIIVTIDNQEYCMQKLDDVYYLIKKEDTVNKENAIARLTDTGYTNKENFFSIVFDLQKVKALGLDGKDIVITYQTALMSDAENNNSENTASLTYSNSPYDKSSNGTITDKTKVYTYSIKLNKTFSDGKNTKDNFDGVSFKLYKDNKKENGIKFTGQNGNYKQSPDGTIDELKLAEDGALNLQGLGEGTYYLEESITDALKNAGYDKVSMITVVISAKTDDTVFDSSDLKIAKQGGSESASIETPCTATLDAENLPLSTDSGYDIILNVLNQKGFSLPRTGGLGNWMFAIIGILLVACGAMVIFLANRKKQDGK